MRRAAFLTYHKKDYPMTVNTYAADDVTATRPRILGSSLKLYRALFQIQA
jgi:hypothetical protein